ncbi:methyltransferase [Candidatus Pacearchaeota archaeon]|nr:methyltransferase [Candidatus Pacearchaeota archaeon]
MEIYQPREDSYLLARCIASYLKDNNKKRHKDLSILDMGTGSGVQAKTALDLGFENITVADINQLAISQLKEQNKDLKIIYSDLFSNIEDSFDLIVFNPPYLPEDKREPKESRVATTAGEQGYEIIVKFLDQAKSHLKEDGEILLLFSSLSKSNVILKHARKLRYKYELIGKEKIDFEELFVYKFYLQN